MGNFLGEVWVVDHAEAPSLRETLADDQHDGAAPREVGTIDGWQKIAGVVSCHGLAGDVTIAM